MGSITRYTAKIENDICHILFECEGDFGECDNGCELVFEMDTWIQKKFNLRNDKYLNWQMLQQIKEFVVYKTFLFL